MTLEDGTGYGGFLVFSKQLFLMVVTAVPEPEPEGVGVMVTPETPMLLISVVGNLAEAVSLAEVGTMTAEAAEDC